MTIPAPKPLSDPGRQADRAGRHQPVSLPSRTRTILPAATPGRRHSDAPRTGKPSWAREARGASQGDRPNSYRGNGDSLAGPLQHIPHRKPRDGTADSYDQDGKPKIAIYQEVGAENMCRRNDRRAGD